MAAIREYNCYGYINHNFQIVVPPKYGRGGGDFKEGLARVATPKIFTETSYGFINKKGWEVIPLIYEMANNFNEGLVSVQLHGKWGAIDKRGNIVIDFQFDVLSDCINSHFLFIQDNRLGVLDKKGKIIVFSERMPDVPDDLIDAVSWCFHEEHRLHKEETGWVLRDRDGTKLFTWGG